MILIKSTSKYGPEPYFIISYELAHKLHDIYNILHFSVTTRHLYLGCSCPFAGYFYPGHFEVQDILCIVAVLLEKKLFTAYKSKLTLKSCSKTYKCKTAGFRLR